MKKSFVIGLATGLTVAGASLVLANSQIQAILNDQIKVTLNGQVQEFKDETTNETQYPITYHDRTYLPLRTVANLVGVDVDYDTNSNTAILNDKSNKYIVNVPQININSDDVKRINNHILELFKKYEEYGVEYTAEHIPRVLQNVNSNILSVVIIETTEGSGVTYRTVYNIDLNTGTQISNTELLNKYGMSEKQFRDILTNVANKDISHLDGIQDIIKSNNGSPIYDYSNMLLDDFEIYLNDLNEICVWADVLTVAGAGHYNININITKSSIISGGLSQYINR